MKQQSLSHRIMHFIKTHELSLLVLISVMILISFFSAILSHTNALITPPQPIELNNNPSRLTYWTSHLGYWKNCDSTGCIDLSFTCNFNQAFIVMESKAQSTPIDIQKGNQICASMSTSRYTCIVLIGIAFTSLIFVCLLISGRRSMGMYLVTLFFVTLQLILASIALGSLNSAYKALGEIQVQLEQIFVTASKVTLISVPYSKASGYSWIENSFAFALLATIFLTALFIYLLFLFPSPEDSVCGSDVNEPPSAKDLSHLPEMSEKDLPEIITIQSDDDEDSVSSPINHQ